MYNAKYYVGNHYFDRKRIEDIRNRTSANRNVKARANMEEVRRQKEQHMAKEDAELTEEQRQIVDRIMKETSPQRRVDDIVQAVNICKEASMQTKVKETVAGELAKL